MSSNSSSAIADLPIGIFDSGVGGLTVLDAIRQQLPNEDLLYLGDTARVPYGSKSSQSVIRYARQAADFMVEQGVKALVIACNTASAVAIEDLQQRHPELPVIGVIEPGAEAAVAGSENGEIAVVATESTVNGGAYLKAIRHRKSDAVVKSQACSLFVSLAEEGWTEGELVEAILSRYLTPLFSDPDHHPDTLVLGCTHYPVLKQAIANVVGPHVTLVDSAQTTSNWVQQQLQQANLLRQQDGSGRLHYLVTDGPERFARVAELFLGHPVPVSDIELVDLQ
jgi:glutamate racemase